MYHFSAQYKCTLMPAQKFMRMKISATIKDHGLPFSQNKLAYFKISVVM